MRPRPSGARPGRLWSRVKPESTSFSVRGRRMIGAEPLHRGDSRSSSRQLTRSMGMNVHGLREGTFVGWRVDVPLEGHSRHSAIGFGTRGTCWRGSSSSRMSRHVAS
jgi:hypothetical protein